MEKRNRITVTIYHRHNKNTVRRIIAEMGKLAQLSKTFNIYNIVCTKLRLQLVV